MVSSSAAKREASGMSHPCSHDNAEDPTGKHLKTKLPRKNALPRLHQVCGQTNKLVRCLQGAAQFVAHVCLFFKFTNLRLELIQWHTHQKPGVEDEV